MFVDPLARKELSGVSRRWQTWLARSAYVGLVALVVWRSWQDVVVRLSYAGISDYAEIARGLFHVSFWGQLLLIVVASAAAATDLVGREIRSGTLGLLLITPLPGRAIALGKWKAAMVHGCSLVLCGLPVTAICVYLGGVGVLDLVWSTALLAATASVTSAYALYYAVRHPDSERTFLGVLGMILAFTVVPIAGLLAGPFAVLLVFYVHPVWAALAATFPLAFGPVAESGWIGSALFSAVLTRWLLRKAGNELLRWKPPRLEAPPTGPSLDVLIRAGLHTPVCRAPVWERFPLLWKEVSLRATAWRSPSARAIPIGMLLVFSSIVLLVGMDHPREVYEPLLFLFVLLAVGSGAFVFSARREDRTWDVLLSTPFTPGQIVAAKLLGGLLSGEALAILGVSMATALLLGREGGPGGMALAMSTWLAYLLFAYLAGAAASVRSRSLRGALVVALALLGLPLVLPGMPPFLDPRTPEPFPGFLAAYGTAAAILAWSMVRAVRRKPLTA